MAVKARLGWNLDSFLRPRSLASPRDEGFPLTTAEEAGIKYQYYCGKGGTDAGAAHLKKWWCPINNNRCLRSLYPLSPNPLCNG